MSKIKSIALIKKLSLSFILLSLVVMASCERENRMYAERTPAAGSEVAYTQTSSISTIPHSAGILSVLPKGPGGGALDGQELFIKNCSACHQATGLGLPGVFPPLAKSPYVTSDNVDRLASIMIYGLAGPVNVLGTTYSSVMAPLGNLSNEELAAIATYARASFGNSAGPVDASVFQASRDKYGSRSFFNISELGEEK